MLVLLSIHCTLGYQVLYGMQASSLVVAKVLWFVSLNLSRFSGSESVHVSAGTVHSNEHRGTIKKPDIRPLDSTGPDLVKGARYRSVHRRCQTHSSTLSSIREIAGCPSSVRILTVVVAVGV